MTNNFYKEIYEMCQEAIDPHLIPQRNGGFSITKESLIPSVVESLEYLIDFWLTNKDRKDIDLCGAGE